MLSERQVLVLKAIIEEYVETNEPVGSRTLSKRSELAFSPATIRNDMADLEEMGLLEKTHTSSGRIPSEQGYRNYVKLILDEKAEREYDFPMIDRIFSQQDITKEQAINESIALVTDLTKYAAVTLGQNARISKIKRLEFIPLQDNYAIILMVTDRGHVESKRIIVPDWINISEITKVMDVLNEILENVQIIDIELKLKEAMEEESVIDALKYREELVAVFINAFSDMVVDKYQVTGQTNILEQPEFQDVQKAREVFEAIENREIFKVIKMDENGVSVRIGNENEIKAMRNCTIITVPYEYKSGKGAISVIGPTRMQYDKIIPLLEYIATHIKKIV